jgi:SNF2 family DNA or RNA helicase
MLVHTKSRKLVLNLKNPAKVTGIIPTARSLALRGQPYVAVPHRLDEVRVLRNIGIQAPGPIRYYYDWPGMYKPFAHQLETADFFTLHRRAFCLNGMGTGKTVSVLWAYDFLREYDYTKGSMLIVAPLSTLERVWADEVFKHFPHLNVSVLHGTQSRRLKLLEQGADVLVINHDGIKGEPVLKALEERVRDGRIAVVVPDELASFRNSQTDRWKALRRLVQPAQYVWGLTGTPIPNEPTDAWAQVRLLTPDAVPKYFNAFRDAVMRQISKFKWVAREGALDHVHSVMQPAIRFHRSDCLDLPPTTYVMREAPMSPPQEKAFKQMLTRMQMDYEGGQITALNEAVAQMKLVQIACGAVKDGDDVVAVEAGERIELVKELVEQSEGKVIVFVPFRAPLAILAQALEKVGVSVRVVHGSVSKHERDEIFGDFQKSKEPRVIVAQPGTMSHGLTLTAANTIVWFAPVNSAETYLQACARIVRPGQKLNTLIVHIEGCALERKMYARLQRREATQGLLLEMFKEKEVLTT